jgi:hypothetical protein
MDGKNCTIKGLKEVFETYVVIDMKIVGTISSKEEAHEIQMIAKLSIVAARARFLGKHDQKNNT